MNYSTESFCEHASIGAASPPDYRPCFRVFFSNPKKVHASHPPVHIKHRDLCHRNMSISSLIFLLFVCSDLLKPTDAKRMKRDWTFSSTKFRWPFFFGGNLAIHPVHIHTHTKSQLRTMKSDRNHWLIVLSNAKQQKQHHKTENYPCWRFISARDWGLRDNRCEGFSKQQQHTANRMSMSMLCVPQQIARAIHASEI